MGSFIISFATNTSIEKNINSKKVITYCLVGELDIPTLKEFNSVTYQKSLKNNTPLFSESRSLSLLKRTQMFNCLHPSYSIER